MVDLPNKNVASTKGIVVQPDRIGVDLLDDEDVKRTNAAAEAQKRKDQEARQNALPEWIVKSTVTGDITTVGAKEKQLERARDAHAAVIKEDEGEEKKSTSTSDDAVMAAYWAELAAAKEKEAQAEREEEEDGDDDEEDEFEDVDVSGAALVNANGVKHSNGASTSGMNTPMNVESSNATDDERDAKRVKLEAPRPAEDTPAASDADEDELDFEDV